MLVRILALTALAFSAIPASAAPRQPTEKWVVDFDDAQCVAKREYGTAEQPMTLILKQPALGSVMQVAVRAKGYFSGDPEQVPGAIRFDAQPTVKIPALQWRPAGAAQTFRMINVPLDTFEAAKSAATFRFEAGRMREDFALADVPALMRVMDSCVTDLREVWNVGTEVTVEGKTAYVAPSLKSPGEADLAGIFSGSDYPGAALMQRTGGNVRVVVLVDEAGKAADCSIVESSGVAVLDSQACAIIQERGKFTPAVGLDGKPAKSAHTQVIRWRVSA